MRAERLLVPLGCYLFICLGLPLLNGSGARAEFWPHALGVAGAAVVTVAIVSALLRAARGSGRGSR